MNFNEKYGPWALIAGASEGTGASYAHQLAEKGLNLILVARREAPLQKLAAEITAQHNVECVIASIDLSLADADQQMAAAAGDREVGLLIFNAGADDNGSRFLDNKIENWISLSTRNTQTVMTTCYHFAGLMRARGRGGIILMGSGAGYGGLPGIAVYCATKAYNLMFAESLWAELKDDGIDVLSYMIGRTDTPAHRKLMEEQGIEIPDNMADADKVARLGLERLPFGPVCNWGQEDDQAAHFSTSAATRRQRVVTISAASAAYGGKK